MNGTLNKAVGTTSKVGETILLIRTRPSAFRVQHALFAGGSFGFACLLLASSWGCQGTTPAGSTDPTPTGAELFAMITQANPYQQWAQFPDHQGALPSAPPHGPTSKVFINDKVASTLTSFTGRLPDGSIIVKENVGTDPQITEAALTVMWKVTGFNPEDNDWFWANMSMEGEVMAEGKVSGCINCHGAVRLNDFIFVHEF